MTLILSYVVSQLMCESEHVKCTGCCHFTCRDKVMELLREMDPVGTRQRKHRRLQCRVYRNKGPNCVWHVDGYDKL